MLFDLPLKVWKNKDLEFGMWKLLDISSFAIDKSRQYKDLLLEIYLVLNLVLI